MTKKLPFKNMFLLAPMERINDIAFRLLCKKSGAGATYTGMIHPSSKEKIYLEDFPVLQPFANSEKGISNFIKKHDNEVIAWDFNLGCPAKLARKHGFGSFLTDLNTIEKIIKKIRNSTKKPIGVKFRKSDISFNILKIAEKYCDFVCIHPRTQKQGYSGKPDISFAKKIKDSTNLPVIYSGDVSEKNFKDLKKFDYLMIGRRAIGRPEIFSKLTKNKTKKFTFKDYLKLAEKYSLYFKQIKTQAINFTKDKKNAAKLRKEIVKCKSLEELYNFVNKI